MKMITRTLFAASVVALAAAGGAQAQTTSGAQNPEMPSALECKQGYKEDMRWSREAFEAACVKVETNAVPAGQTK